jgi:hypothetical protein
MKETVPDAPGQGKASAPAVVPLAPFWADVERIVGAHLDDTVGLCVQGLGPLAADLLERDGRTAAEVFVHERQLGRLAMLTAPAVLERVRAALSGPMLLLKGPEVAVRYPQNARAFGDLDILVPDARQAQRALLAAGFVEEEDPEGLWVGIHHLGRIRLPSVPLMIEVHSEPKWPNGLAPPPNEELFAAAVPAAVGVPGILAPAAAHHALLLAAHAWAHQPLRRARDLLDAGVFAAEVDSWELSRLAREWALGRLWSTTSAALAAFVSGRRTWPLRLWAGHVSELRVQTVVEEHLERLLAPFWGFPVETAFRLSARALGDEFRPAFDETWSEKWRRSAAAVRRGFVPVTRHRALLGESARRGQRRHKPPAPPD